MEADSVVRQIERIKRAEKSLRNIKPAISLGLLQEAALSSALRHKVRHDIELEFVENVSKQTNKTYEGWELGG